MDEYFECDAISLAEHLKKVLFQHQICLMPVCRVQNV